MALSRRMPGLSCPRASVPWASGLWVWTGTSPQLSRASSLQTAHGGTSQPQSPRGNPHENRLSVYPRMSHWLCVCGDPRLLYSSCVRPTQTARGHLPSLDPQFNHIRKVPFDVQGHVHRFWARDWMPFGGRHPTDHRHRLQTPRDQRGTEGDHGEAFPVVGTEVGRRERSEQAGSGAPGLMPTQPGSFTRVISAEAPAGLCDGRSVPLSPCPRGELAATAASRRGLRGSTRPSRRELVLGNTRHREWALYKPRTRVILVQRNPRAPCSGAWWCTLQEEASRRLPDRGIGRPCSGAAVAPGRRGPEGWGRVPCAGCPMRSVHTWQVGARLLVLHQGCRVLTEQSGFGFETSGQRSGAAVWEPGPQQSCACERRVMLSSHGCPAAVCLTSVTIIRATGIGTCLASL